MLEQATFALALLGYAGLTLTAVLSAHARLPVWFWRATAVIIVAHVALVWAVRYEWRLATATRNGYAGFLIFHGALALILASIFLTERRARVFVWLAFGIVSLGAIGAVFRYDVVAMYRLPVLLLAAGGAAALTICWRGRNRVRD